MVFPGYVHAQNNAILPRYSIIKPNDSVCTKGLLLAKAVVVSNCPVVPVHVLNLSDKASKLYKESVLGTCTHVDEVLNIEPITQCRLGKTMTLETNIEGDLPLWPSG